MDPALSLRAPGANSVRPRRHWMGKWVRRSFGIAGFLGVLAALARAWGERGPTFPPPYALLVAFALSVLVVIAAPRGWVALIGAAGERRSLIRGYYAALLGRYIPGGLWQAMGQIGFARDAGTSWSLAATGFAVHSVAQVSAAAALGAGLAFSGAGTSESIRIAALAGFLLVCAVYRGWMSALVSFIGRRVRMVDPSLLPPQRAILDAFAWSLLTTGMAGIAYWVLLASLVPDIGLARVISAFALAWAAGFIAVVFPSGIGVREAVLVAALGSAAGPVLAASLAHRIVGIVAEMIVILWSRRGAAHAETLSA